MNTASCSSSITYIDGDAGILRYRGYPIEELAEHTTFLEVVYLLIYGELPNEDQRADLTEKIRIHTLLHEDMKQFFDGFPRDAHPMAVLSSGVSALSTFYQDNLDPFDDDEVEISTVRLLAKVPTIASYAYKKSIGQPFLYPDNRLGYVENFLQMTFGVPTQPYEVDPEVREDPRHAVRAARRPRAELFYVDGSARWLESGKPVRIRVRRHQRAVRAAPRRRQSSRAGDAAAASRRMGATCTTSFAASRTSRTA